ncbi:MAG TPA: hypothetical protein VFM35_02560 [Candidatus Binatia bacterium]|nr:hypothetical protein [Candidatus Binatia bacterium]
MPGQEGLERIEPGNEKSGWRRYRSIKHLRTVPHEYARLFVCWLPIIKDVRTALAADPLPLETIKALLAA